MIEQERVQAGLTEAELGIPAHFIINTVAETDTTCTAIAWRNVLGELTVLDATSLETEPMVAQGWTIEGLEDYTVGA